MTPSPSISPPPLPAHLRGDPATHPSAAWRADENQGHGWVVECVFEGPDATTTHHSAHALLEDAHREGYQLTCLRAVHRVRVRAAGDELAGPICAWDASDNTWRVHRADILEDTRRRSELDVWAMNALTHQGPWDDDVLRGVLAAVSLGGLVANLAPSDARRDPSMRSLADRGYVRRGARWALTDSGRAMMSNTPPSPA